MTSAEALHTHTHTHTHTHRLQPGMWSQPGGCAGKMHMREAHGHPEAAAGSQTPRSSGSRHPEAAAAEGTQTPRSSGCRRHTDTQKQRQPALCCLHVGTGTLPVALKHAIWALPTLLGTLCLCTPGCPALHQGPCLHSPHLLAQRIPILCKVLSAPLPPPPCEAHPCPTCLLSASLSFSSCSRSSARACAPLGSRLSATILQGQDAGCFCLCECARMRVCACVCAHECVRVLVCVCVCICVCACVCESACVCVSRVCVCLCVSRVCVCVSRVYMCMCACECECEIAHVCVKVCACGCACVYVCVRACACAGVDAVCHCTAQCVHCVCVPVCEGRQGRWRSARRDSAGPGGRR